MDNADWVRQRVLKDRVRAGRRALFMGRPTPPTPNGSSSYHIVTTGWVEEYVDQQVAEAMDIIQDSMNNSAKWVNRRIVEEIAKEKASFYRFLLRQAVCFMVGIVIGWLVTGWLWGSMV